MSIVTFRGKVKLISESDMEIFHDDEDKTLGSPKSEKWVWKNISLPAYEIMMAIEYNPTKTVLVTESFGKILVLESHSEVTNKWKAAYSYEEEDEGFNIKGENNSKEEDE